MSPLQKLLVFFLVLLLAAISALFGYLYYQERLLNEKWECDVEEEEETSFVDEAIQKEAVKSKEESKRNETMDLRVFFQNNLKGSAEECSKVFAVTRSVEKTQAPARQALELLLSGVSSQEKEKGYSSLIPVGVKLQKINIEKGAARVDFDETLDKGVAGSCSVLGIRSQIEETLKQFEGVKSVIISINGRTEDVLQP